MHELKKVGSPPGTLVHIGKKRSHDVKVTQYLYSKDHLESFELKGLDDIKKDSDKRSWIDVTGIHDTSIVEEFGRRYDIHPLVLEDIMNSQQRPKLEEYEDYVFIVLKAISVINKGMEMEQISIVMFEDYVITFQEGTENAFANIVERLERSKGKLRMHGCDYLTYALIDTVVDRHFLVLEMISEDIQRLEHELMHNVSKDFLIRIQSMKNELADLRKTTYSHREIMNKMEKMENELFKESTAIYLRDVYDHLVQIMESIETYREMLSGLLEIYLSNLSNKMNEVMKVLTIIATIFIPLSFIAGVFGMNFVNMPELEWKWAYPFTLFGMFTIAIVMVLFFKKKRWL